MSEMPAGNEPPKSDAGMPPADGESAVPKSKRSHWPVWLALGVFLLAIGGIVVPKLVVAWTTPCCNACIANLKQIDGAVQQWALENKKTATDMPTVSDVTPYLKDNKLPTCPQHGVYKLHIVSKNPTCSFPGHTL